MGSCLSKSPDAPTTSGKGNVAKPAKRPIVAGEKQTSQSQPGQSTTANPASGAAVSQDKSTKAADAVSVGKNGSANGTVAAPVAGTKEVKLLLLGSGESGKSTIVKQVKILHQNGYTKEELYEYRPFIYRNVLECIKQIINAIIDLEPELIRKDADATLHNSDSTDGGKHKIEDADGSTDAEGDTDAGTTTNGAGGDPQVQDYENGKPASRREVLDYDVLNDILDYELTMSVDETFDPDIAQKIAAIYSTPEVQNFIKYQQGNFYLIDSTRYFLGDVARLSQPDFLPSVDDVLHTRKKTSGIFDFKFQMSGGLNIHLYDVGGQRSERKKWIHCFDNVTLIIFCVSLSEYDQVLLEENSQNRLVESLTLFDSVVNSRWFARTSIVLFLNKIDVFAEKLPYSPLEKHFPDYTGGNNINKAAKYILWRFTQVNRSGLNIYPHVTQATDTSNIELVLAAVKETILENSLRDSGIL
ncbi:Guanine nucleotide-binding protein alpha-2 subunit [[Candida] zeylanoides]